MVPSSYLLLCYVVILATIFGHSDAQIHLDLTNGQKIFDFVKCPLALSIIRRTVENEIKREPCMGASLIRLHFADCFVNGCDGSVLLADTANFIGERTAFQNNNSLRGFEVIDRIKDNINRACPIPVVSCADILAVAARDSVVALGGPSYKVELGRRDAVTASWTDANTNLPEPSHNINQLLTRFQTKDLNLQDLVVLSAAHTIGEARCVNFRDRIYNDINIDQEFAAGRRLSCPPVGSDSITAGLDGKPINFDVTYFNDLLAQKGLLHSDQELLNTGSPESDGLVRKYSNSLEAFKADFGDSMIKMSNLKPPPGARSEIRTRCYRTN